MPFDRLRANGKKAIFMIITKHNSPLFKLVPDLFRERDIGGLSV
jgi:hypothetical protein